MPRDSFLMRGVWEAYIAPLNMEQRGELLTAIFSYQNRNEAPAGDPAVQVSFNFMRDFFDETSARYAKKVQANQENGKLGGRPSTTPKDNPLGFSDNPSKPKKTLSESESDSESESFPPSEGGGKRAGKPRFTPPTLEEVAAYVSERGSPVVPQEFIDFYASKGWLVGKTPMKDWKAACRNAEKWDRWKRPTASEKSANIFLDMLEECK